MSYSFHAYQQELFPTGIRARAAGFVYSWSRLSVIFSSFIIAFVLEASGAFGVFVFIAAAMAIVMVTIGRRTTNLALEKISQSGDGRRADADATEARAAPASSRPDRRERTTRTTSRVASDTRRSRPAYSCRGKAVREAQRRGTELDVHAAAERALLRRPRRPKRLLRDGCLAERERGEALFGRFETTAKRDQPRRRAERPGEVGASRRGQSRRIGVR